MIIKKFRSKITSIHPICDIEISNDITNPKGGDWFYDKSDIITIGLINGNEITIIQKEKGDKKEDLKNEVEKLLPLRFYSFNYKMEKLGLLGFFKLNYHVEEIKPWMGRGFNKDKFYQEVQAIIKPIDDFKDPLNEDSSLVQERYTENKYDDIIMHNYNCLLKEAYILKFRPALIKKYKANIKPDGWWKDDIQ